VTDLSPEAIGATAEAQDELEIEVLERQMAEAEAATLAWAEAEKERLMADAEAGALAWAQAEPERRLAEADDAQHAYATEWFASLPAPEQRRVAADVESFARMLSGRGRHGDGHREAPAIDGDHVRRQVTARPRERRARSSRRTCVTAGASDDGPGADPPQHHAADGRVLPALTRALHVEGVAS
jgi:hypothetical protein